jgi:drug/metabolite transporter (DMT)-like permease
LLLRIGPNTNCIELPEQTPTERTNLNWYLGSLLAAVAFTVALLCLQRLQNTYPIDVYLFFVWLGTTLAFSYALPDALGHITLGLGIILFFTGIVNWFANYAYNVAISRQPNLGYVEAASSVRVLLLYVVSLVWFEERVEFVRVMACLGIIVGIFIIRGPSPNPYGTVKKGWLPWAIISGITLGLMIIGNRYANDHGLTPSMALSIWLIPATALYGASSIIKGYKLKLKWDKSVLVLMLAIAAYVVANIGLFGAYSSAPNLAYPTVINNSRLILMYVASLVITSEKMSIKSIMAMLLTLASIVMLA